MINRHIIFCTFILLSAFLLSWIFQPTYHSLDKPLLISSFIPETFGEWTQLSSNQLKVGVYTDDKGNSEGLGPYDQVVNKEYVNANGEKVLLTIAWVQSQRQEVKVHRPELCYPAQGFSITNLKNKTFDLKSLHGKYVQGKEMLASNGAYSEAVSYWIRTGDMYSTNPWEVRYYLFKQGLKGEILDGALIRVSTPYSTQKQLGDLFKINQTFIGDLIAELSDQEVHLKYLIN